MTHSLWFLIFYQPIYNALFFLISVVPWGDVGIAVILLTVIVKLILFPLAKKSIVSQVKLKSLEADIQKIKESGASKEEQAKKTFELYKINKANPLSGCLIVIIQLPIIFALYKVFLQAFNLDESSLYSFVHFPDVINSNFLGLIDMHEKSLVLALIAGITQFFQMKLITPPAKKTNTDAGKPSFKDELAKSMNMQMKYFLPVFITIVAYQVSSAAALYWATSNLFTIGQEIIVRRKLKEENGMLEVKATVLEK